VCFFVCLFGKLFGIWNVVGLTLFFSVSWPNCFYFVLNSAFFYLKHTITITITPALIGAQISDHVFLLMTDAAVEIMFHNNGNIQLGADIGVAVGPLGRALEADVGAAPGSVAPIYTYSLSKGLYAGISLDGKVIVTRDRVNEKFYGRTVSGMDILQGQIPTPPAARPLYDALQRCHVYATGNTRSSSSTSNATNDNATIPPTAHPKSSDMEYGELPEPIPVYPPATNDHHSYAGMSDITSDPGY
jgi:hypothetical protein